MMRGATLIAVGGVLSLATFANCQEKQEEKSVTNTPVASVSDAKPQPKEDVNQQEEGKEKKLKYMGAETCKNCHRAKAIGAQYTKWKKWKMADAYEALSTDKAKEIGKKNGVDDPQKSDKCLKCHTTAFGVDPKLLGKKFDKKQGIQCEACHGPGEQHAKNRMAGADQDDETQHKNAVKEMPLPTKEVCSKCHNEEAFDITGIDTFWDKEKKEFKLDAAWKEIDHPNPKWKKKK